MEYLEAHMTQDISLEEMAKLAGLSQSQFARSFKISTGMPPYKWFLDARIKRAQELLLHGNESIAFIAIQTGFADQSHFTKTFRHATGATPKTGNEVANSDPLAEQDSSIPGTTQLNPCVDI